MKNKIVLATGMAIGYVLGSRAGRDSYEKLKSKANEFWSDPKVQEKVSGTTEALKNKAPEAQEQAGGVLKKAQSGLRSTLHRDDKSTSDQKEGIGRDGTGPSGGHPAKIEDPPFQNQAPETRPNN